MSRARSVLLVGLAIASAAAGARATSWHHPEFALSRPETLAILPIEASITRGKVNDAEPMIKESGDLERALLETVASELRAKGYAVDDTTLQRHATAAGGDLQDAVQRVASRIEEALGVMSSKPRSIREGRFSIGDSGLPLAAATRSDGLVLLRARSIIPSKGTRALSGVLSTVFGGIPYVPTTKLEVLAVIVDARTGELQAVFDDVVSGPILKETAKVGAEGVRAAFHGYPRKGEQLRLTKRDRRELERQEAERPSRATPAVEPSASADVVAEFEKAYEESGSDAVASREDDEVDGLAPLPVQPVLPAEPWTPDGQPLSAADAASGERSPPAGALPGTSPASASAVIAGPPDAAIEGLYRVNAPDRPAPTHQPVIQVTDGTAAGLMVQNASAEALRVSVNLTGWLTLRPGELLRVELPPMSHRILVTGPEGRERMRLSVMVLPGRVTNVEIHPL